MFRALQSNSSFVRSTVYITCRFDRYSVDMYNEVLIKNYITRGILFIAALFNYLDVPN